MAHAHSAIAAKADKYSRTRFMIRSRRYAGLNKETMNIGPLADDERCRWCSHRPAVTAGVATACRSTISFQRNMTTACKLRWNQVDSRLLGDRILKKIILHLIRLHTCDQTKTSLRLTRTRAARDDEVRMKILGFTKL